MQISLAPIQGYTEYPFRNALNSIIGGVDEYYSPFLRFENNGSVKNKYIKDILPENNSKINLIPQILTNSAEEFLQFIKTVENFGYKEVNWNLGCPFTPVVKRKLGSGLLAYPETINNVLTEVFNKTDINISVKLRSGYSTETEIFDVLNVLNKFNLTEIIYHPRIGKQQYKGVANIELFKKVKSLSVNKISYNGDITSTDNFINIKNRLKDTGGFMIGRGLLQNIFLAKEIKTAKTITTEEKMLLFE
jgi:tRNA-dihydrouridine synthase